VKTQYSYSRGVATGVKDLNGVVTITEYNDPYDRPTRITAAYSLAEASKTEMSYPTAVANQTTVSKQLDSTRWLAYKTTYDGFGRPLTGNEAEDGNHALVANFTITSRRIYDGLGRIIFATNAYRSSPASTDGWTRTAYDLAGRVIDVATFSGSPSTQPPDYPATTGTGVTWTGSVQTSYASEVTTVTDQAGKQRRSVVDGIGRLVSIVEDPTGFGYQTNYSYDARGNLKTVSQGVQTRTFSYDTLSRLTSATNPESGQVTYTYDLASNLKTRLDNRGITTTYNYDAINRVTSRTYSGDPENTPPVSYFYDGQTLPSGAPPAFVRGSSVGRVVAVTYGSGSSNGTYTGYDHLGRVNTSVQQTDGANHAFSYAYNLAGMIASETYPSNRQVTTSFDGAGRTSQIVGTLAGQNTTYASNFSYTAHDAPGVLKLGNNKWEHTSFSSRLEPTQIGLGNSSSDSSILQLDYGYGSTNNNGNVLSQTITVGATVMSQAYSYDSLNRLSSANENNGTDWSQTYGYDRYGNRWVSASTGYNLSPLTPTGSGAFSASNNKLIASGYDNAGNQTTDVQGRQFAYDAENRQIRFNNTVGRYFYDGDGHRVKKIDASGTTVFVYNSMGQLIAEYSDVAASGPGGTSYLTADHLGSTRVVTDEGGNVKARHDYLPFGEEIPANIGGRSSVPGYSAADTTRQRFGGKERDAESNLDYFGGRYYGSATGRFNSPDPIIISARRMINPQIWNLYSYVGNNPLSYIDPNGEELVKLGQHTDEEIKRRQQEIDQQLKSLKKDQSLTKDQRKEQEQKLKAEKKTLGLEREGNKAVGALLNALDKIGQRNGLALSDFTLSTDTKNDFKGFATPDAMKKLLNDQAFVIRDNPKFGGTIYIRTEPAAGFYQLSQRNSDFLYYGATSVRHEQEHLLGRGEGPAYRVQDNVMHLFQNYFQNRDLYKGLDEALHDAIKKNP
jgi:RHS repeat-associated protein